MKQIALSIEQMKHIIELVVDRTQGLITFDGET